MMTVNEQLQSVLRVAVAVLCVGALVLLVVVLSSNSYDSVNGKAFGTAVALAFVSLSVAAGRHLISRQPRIAAVGYLTILVGGLAFLVSIDVIWKGSPLETSTTEHWAWYTLIGTFALGVASMLLAGHDDGNPDSVKLVRGMTVFAVFALFVAVIAEVRTPGQQVDPHVLAAFGVFFLLGTLLLPLLSWTSDEGIRQALVEGLDHAVIAVSDRGRSDRFYSEVLGAGIETDASGSTAYRIGDQRLNVHAPWQSRAPLAADPVRPGNSDLCFVWPGNAESALQHLRSRGVEVVEGPVVRGGARGTGVSVYCRDPDGSLIELISYR